MKCPTCGKGELKNKIIKESMHGVMLGEFSAQVCSKCNESFTDIDITKKIEDAAKKAGVWDLGKKTKITRSGNSLAIRLPKEIATFMKLKEGSEVYINPEKNRIIIESD
jgi:transposase-like protein